MHKLGLAPTSICECDTLDQTASYLILEYPCTMPPEDIIDCWSSMMKLDVGLTLPPIFEKDFAKTGKQPMHSQLP